MVLADRAAERADLGQVIHRGAGEDVQSLRHGGALSPFAQAAALEARPIARSRWKSIAVASAARASTAGASRAFACRRSRSPGAPRSKATIGSPSAIISATTYEKVSGQIEGKKNMLTP